MNPAPPFDISISCSLEDASRAAFAALQASAWTQFEVSKWMLAFTTGRDPTASERESLLRDAFVLVLGMLPDASPFKAALAAYRDAVMNGTNDPDRGSRPGLRSV